MTEAEIAKAMYAALNANDIPGALKNFAPDARRIEPAGFGGVAEERNFTGYEKLLEHFVQGRSAWAEGGCYPEETFTSGNKVVIFVHVRVRRKGQESWNEGRIADGFTFRGGKIVEFISFAERAQAMEWAGLKHGG